jgi:RHS repeat-associated protein
MGGAPGNKLYWYGSGGEILSETDASGNTLNEYIFFGGKRVAQVPASGGPLYYAEDMLGSSRVMVQSNGTLCFDADFTPFGGERDYTTTCATAYKFEGKERDAETQNDNFGAREYSWRFGRWLSADWSATPVAVPYANLANPQTLNLYSMVADDPESFADLDGHTPYGGDGIRLGCDPGQVMCTTDIGEGRLVVRGPGDMDSATDDAKMEVVESNPDSVGQANGAAFAAWAGETGNSGGPAQNLIPASVLQRMQEDLHSGKFGQFGDPSQGTLNINFDSLLKKTSDFSAGAGDCLTGTLYSLRTWFPDSIG